MFERFTERARQVVVLANEEAHGLKHGYIGTEHILLGLIREEQGIAAQVLESFDVTLERVRGEVVRTVGVGEAEGAGQIPFTPRAKRVLELALREALELDHTYIGTEHILLGLLADSDGVAARILRDCAAARSAAPEAIRGALISRLEAPSPPQPTLLPRGAGVEEGIRVNPSASVRRLLMAAGARALDDGRTRIEPRDVLRALVRDGETGPVLADLGVDEKALIKALARRRGPEAPPQATAEG